MTPRLENRPTKLKALGIGLHGVGDRHTGEADEWKINRNIKGLEGHLLETGASQNALGVVVGPDVNVESERVRFGHFIDRVPLPAEGREPVEVYPGASWFQGSTYARARGREL